MSMHNVVAEHCAFLPWLLSCRIMNITISAKQFMYSVHVDTKWGYMETNRYIDRKRHGIRVSKYVRYNLTYYQLHSE